MNKGTATLAEIIRQIEKQTDYLFIYNEREVSLKRKVSISTQDGTVASLLLDALHGTEFSYTMEGKHIILTEKQAGSAKSCAEQEKSDRTSEGIFGRGYRWV